LDVLKLPAKQKADWPPAAIGRPRLQALRNYTTATTGRTRMSDEYAYRSTLLACCLIAAMVLLLTWAVIDVSQRVSKFESQAEAWADIERRVTDLEDKVGR
jgi:hypothetical protein